MSRRVVSRSRLARWWLERSIRTTWSGRGSVGPAAIASEQRDQLSQTPSATPTSVQRFGGQSVAEMATSARTGAFPTQSRPSTSGPLGRAVPDTAAAHGSVETAAPATGMHDGRELHQRRVVDGSRRSELPCASRMHRRGAATTPSVLHAWTHHHVAGCSMYGSRPSGPSSPMPRLVGAVYERRVLSG
jgi:hypothetical protein